MGGGHPRQRASPLAVPETGGAHVAVAVGSGEQGEVESEQPFGGRCLSPGGGGGARAPSEQRDFGGFLRREA